MRRETIDHSNEQFARLVGETVPHHSWIPPFARDAPRCLLCSGDRFCQPSRHPDGPLLDHGLSYFSDRTGFIAKCRSRPLGFLFGSMDKRRPFQPPLSLAYLQSSGLVPWRCPFHRCRTGKLLCVEPFEGFRGSGSSNSSDSFSESPVASPASVSLRAKARCFASGVG